MTTWGRRPSATSVARAWLKYASVYQPARIFSTGRSKMSGSRRLRVVSIGLAPQTRLERCVGHLELSVRRLVGAEAVLELVAGARESPRERMRRVPRHPAEDLRRRGDRADDGCSLRRLSVALRRPVGGEARRRGGDEHRADEMRAAPLVLLRARLTVLVAADRHVLGAVVRGQLTAPQCENGGRKREQAAGELTRRRPQRRTAGALREERAPDHRRGDP